MKKYLQKIGIGLGGLVALYVVLLVIDAVISSKICNPRCDRFRIPMTNICIGEKIYGNGCGGLIIITEPLLTSFSGDCSDNGPAGKAKILKRNFVSADTMKVKVQTEVTCCVDLVGEIEVINENIINLKYIETGEPCDCLCRGVLYYEIQGVDKRKYIFQLNGKEISL